MKIYHGTSFENAAQILSKDYWVYPAEYYIVGSINVENVIFNEIDWDRVKRGHDKLSKNGYLGNHFTTNINTAKIYAKKNARPVILMVEYNGRGSCDDFIISDPIPADRIKCFCGYGGDIEFYGALLNELYGKQCQFNLGLMKKLQGLENGVQLIKQTKDLWKRK